MTKQSKRIDEALKSLLMQAIQKNNLDDLNLALSRITDNKAIEAAAISVFTKKQTPEKIVTAIVNKISDSETIDKILELAIEGRYSRERGGVFKLQMERLLDKTNDQPFLERLIQKSVEKKDLPSINALMPRVKDTSVFDRLALYIFQKGHIPDEIVTSIIEKVSNPVVIKQILEMAVEGRYSRERGGLFKGQMQRLLDKFNDQEIIENLFKKSITNIDVDAINTLLPRIKDKAIIERALIKSFTKGARWNEKVVGILLANVHNKEVLQQVLDLAVQNRHDRNLGGLVKTYMPKVLEKLDRASEEKVLQEDHAIKDKENRLEIQTDSVKQNEVRKVAELPKQAQNGISSMPEHQTQPQNTMQNYKLAAEFLSEQAAFENIARIPTLNPTNPSIASSSNIAKPNLQAPLLNNFSGDINYTMGTALLILNVLRYCGFKVGMMPRQENINVMDNRHDNNFDVSYLTKMLEEEPKAQVYAYEIIKHVEKTKKENWNDQDIVDFVNSEHFKMTRALAEKMERLARKATPQDFGLNKALKTLVYEPRINVKSQRNNKSEKKNNHR